MAALEAKVWSDNSCNRTYSSFGSLTGKSWLRLAFIWPNMTLYYVEVKLALEKMLHRIPLPIILPLSYSNLRGYRSFQRTQPVHRLVHAERFPLCLPRSLLTLQFPFQSK
jgi:hypothetical protein